MDQIASPNLSAPEQAIAISKYLVDKPEDTNTSYYLLPIFSFLRPTAVEVAQEGGDCADRSRLMVVLLGLRGIHAEKWALYDTHGLPHHAVVELQTERGKMVIDPFYDIWFPKPGGGYYNVEELRSDPTILPRRIHELLPRDSPPGRTPLQSYPMKEYVYTYARTINWEKSHLSDLVYRVLRATLGPRVNNITKPSWIERPSAMVIYGATIPEFLCLITLFCAIRPPKKKVAEAPAQLSARFSSLPG